MSDPSSNPFIEAFQAGLSPIPVNTHTKKPLVAWKHYQGHAADFDELTEWDRWFADGRCGIGIVCGRVSGRLICVDIEARCVFGRNDNYEYINELAERLRQAGCYQTWTDATRSYMETTPSGGLHVLIRLEGEGATEPNRKLAMTADGQVLIETRGEGGYAIIAPSRNGHKSWELVGRSCVDTIVWLTTEEWERVNEAFTSLDETPPPPRSIERPREPPAFSLNEPWFDDEVATLPSIEIVLEEHGWTRTRSSDGYGEHWVRPGKEAREGHSASLNHESRRLWVHSSNAGPLPVGVSLDNLDIILCYELGRAPTTADRTDYIVARRKARTPGAPAERPQAASPAAEPQLAGSSLNLRDEFWKSRKYLAHVQQAALAEGVNPDAAWEGTKALFAASVHPRIVIPFKGTLDYIAVMVGQAGAGKTLAKRTAYDLFPAEFREHPRIKLNAPGGTGEGIVEFFIDRSEGTQRQAFDGAAFYIDEGKWLLEVNSRQGNTTIQALKQAWSGELTGSLAATAERNRWLQPGAVRVGVLIAIQPGIATDFLRSDLTEGGFPQRLSWGWSHPDNVPDELPSHPGLLDVPLWTLDHWGTSYDPNAPREMTYDADLMAIVAQARRDSLLGKNTHGGHDVYATLKTAALLALMDDRREVNMSDWELAQLDWNTGIAIRNYLLATQQQGLADQNVTAGRNTAYRKLAEESVYLERAVVALVGKARASSEPLSAREVKDHLRHFSKRHGVHYQEVLILAIERGLMHRTAGGAFTAT